jgi:hypothetical protein
MRKAVMVVLVCVLTSLVGAGSIVWLMSPSTPSGPTSVDSIVYRTGQQVALNSVSYGLERISTPNLDAAGVVCVPAPAEDLYFAEEWPESSSKPDPKHRAALTPKLREVYDCILNCLPTDSKQWEGPSLGASRECFESKISEITEKYGLIDTFTAIGAMLRTHPKLTFFCHKAGHAAGESAALNGIDMHDALVAVGDYCVHGAVHGLFDGFAKKSPTLEDFREVAVICSGLEGSAAGGCTDGMGHAAWDTFGDLGKAADACGQIDDPTLRYSCDEGILMRKYERNDPGLVDTVAEFKEFTAQLRNDCAIWAKSTTLRSGDAFGPGTGCFAGVQYMLWLYPTQLAREYEQERWRKVENFQAYLDELASTCASFGPGGEGLCRAGDGAALAVIANYKVEDFETLCEMVRADVAACVTQAKNLMLYNSGSR